MLFGANLGVVSSPITLIVPGFSQMRDSIYPSTFSRLDELEDDVLLRLSRSCETEFDDELLLPLKLWLSVCK